MTTRLILTSVVIFLLPLLASSQEIQIKYKIDTILNKCLSKNQSDVGMGDCFIKSQDLWDKELNKYYKLLLSVLDTSAQQKLKEAQRQWILFRDKEIQLIHDAYGSNDGSMWNLAIADRINQLIRQRAVDLIGYYETLTQQ